MPEVSNIRPEFLKAHRNKVKSRLRAVPGKDVPVSLYDAVKNLDGEDPDMLSPIEYKTMRAVEDALTSYSAVHERLSDYFNVKSKPDEERIDFVNLAALYTGAAIGKLAMNEVVTELKEQQEYDKSIEYGFHGMDSDKTLTAIIETFRTSMYGAEGEEPLVNNPEKFASLVDVCFGTLVEKCIEMKDDYDKLKDRVDGLTFELYGKDIKLFSPLERAVEFKSDVKFDDIVGNEELKQELKKVGKFLCAYDTKTKCNPLAEKFDMPSRALLYGRPGTGKTMSLQAFVGYMQEECQKKGKPFKFINIGNDIKSKYFGESVQKLKSMLGEAMRGDTICIVTIEDIDGIFAAREELNDRPEEKAILQELMNTLEGVATKNLGNFMLIATTNRPANLDGALGERLREAQYEVKGPETSEQFSKVFQLKMKKAIDNGYCKLPKKSWDKIGKLCHEYMSKYEFSGRGIKNVSKNLMLQAAPKDIPDEIYEMPPEKMKEAVEKLATSITEKALIAGIDLYKNEGIKQEEIRQREKKRHMIDSIIESITYEGIGKKVPPNYAERDIKDLKHEMMKAEGLEE
ncbi:MAG: ATP-binding protein [Candidatus Woesearchaeota archaeon]